MTIFRAFLIVAWAAVVVVTVFAVQSQGVSAAGDVFFADMAAGDWRGQFNVDFMAHLLLIAGWVVWREQFSAKGIVLAVLCVMGGGLVSLAYLLVISITAKGNMQEILTGRRPV